MLKYVKPVVAHKFHLFVGKNKQAKRLAVLAERVVKLAANQRKVNNHTK